MHKFKLVVEKDNGSQALIAVEPLEKGYGHTLGNSLRRTMLNSLGGAAVVSVKIAGVDHQFSTMTGVMEDVIQVILNLKKVRVKVYSDTPGKTKTVKMSLSKSGKGPITASDIDTQGNGEIVNGDQHIATITDDKAKLQIELTVETGSGYVPSEERKSSEIGAISVDAIFSPVLSVNYTVEQTRVGRETNFEKLNLDVVTDGTMSPLEAVNQSAQILAGYFKQVYDPSFDEEVDQVATTSFVSNDLLKASVEELDLPVRISNALKAIEIDTIEKLINVPRVQLIKAKNLGAKSLSLISEKLSERGLALSEA